MREINLEFNAIVACNFSEPEVEILHLNNPDFSPSVTVHRRIGDAALDELIIGDDESRIVRIETPEDTFRAQTDDEGTVITEKKLSEKYL